MHEHDRIEPVQRQEVFNLRVQELPHLSLPHPQTRALQGDPAVREADGQDQADLKRKERQVKGQVTDQHPGVLKRYRYGYQGISNRAHLQLHQIQEGSDH